MNHALARLIDTRFGKGILAALFLAAVAILHVGTQGVSLQTAHALTSLPSFNTHAKDFDTLRSSNYTRFPDSTEHWALTTDANPGDTVSLAVYYHNSAGEDAQNVRISMSVPSGAGSSIKASGALWADNFNQSSGETTIRINGNESLEYIPGSASWYPNQSTTPSPFPFGQTGDEVITAGGVNIGDITSGGETQGSVVARFKVSEGNVIPPAPEGVSSIDVTANGSQGPLNLMEGEAFTVDWISANATACSLSMDGNLLSGVESNGSMGPIDQTHPFYPQASSTRTFTIACGGLSGQITDSVIVARGATVPPPAQPPQAPSLSVTTAPECGGKIAVIWNAVSEATSYALYRDGLLLTTVSDPNFMDTDLVPGETHSYVVRALNSAGESADSNTSSASASQQCGGGGGGNPEPDPSSVDITANGSQGPITLSDNQEFTVDWISANVINCMLSADNFRSGVEANGTLGIIGPDHPYYPSAGGSRTFTLECDNLSGGQSWDSVTIIRPRVPLPPEAPTLNANTSTQCGGRIDLSWNSVSGATGYKVFRGGAFLVNVTLTSYQDTVTPGQTYSYTVKAENNVGDSANSNTVSVSASGSCTGGQTSSLDITANGSQGPLTVNGEAFTVDWVSSNVTSCTLSSDVFSTGVSSQGSVGPIVETHAYYPGVGGSRTFTITCQGLQGQISDSVTVIRPIVETPPSAPIISNISTTCDGKVSLLWNSVSGATSYKVFRNGAEVATVTSPSYEDTGLTAGTLYSYTVRAVNNVGTSPASNVVATTIPNTCDTIPSAPTIFATTGTECGGTIFVSWNAVSNATSYKVFRNGVQVASTSNLSFTDTGLTPGSSYVYTVKSVNSAGESVFSNTASANASATCVVPPPAPVLTALTGTECGGTVALSWTAVSGATGYKVFRNGVQISQTSLTSLADSGLTPGQTYTYTVKAFNGAGDSVSSNGQAVAASLECPLPQPTVNLTANPGTIDQGQNSTLTWTSTNATSCSAPWTTATSTSGSQVVSPSQTTSYTVTCTNGSANVSATATVNVRQDNGGGDDDVTVNLAANPQTILLGATSTLSWTSAHATSCSAPWTTATSTSGSQVVSPATTTTYTISCSKGNDTATDSVTVTVITNPQCLLPSLTSPFTANGKVGQVFSYTFTASSTGSNLSFIVGTSTLPAGLTFANNTISGTPTVSGTFNVPVTVTDSCGIVFDNVIVITIDPQDNGGGNNLTVTLTAEPSTISQGATSTLTWTSTNATSCSAPWTTATSTSGSQVVSPSATTEYVMTCVRVNEVVEDRATVTVTTNTDEEDDDNNSGGGGGRRRSGSSRAPEVLPANLSCDYLKDYLRIGWDNDPVEMIKLQVFLKVLEGFSNLEVNGFFDQATFDAVATFQVRYQPDILTPWGYAQGEYTGFVYILTQKKVNEIVCQKAFPLNNTQEDEIADFKAFLEDLRSRGISIPGITDAETPGTGSGISVGTGSDLGNLGDILGDVRDEEDGGGLFQSGTLRNVAASVFAGPDTWGASVLALALFILAVLVSYWTSKTLVSKSKNDSTEETKRVRTTFGFIGGLVIAVILSFIFRYYVIVLPLLILIIIVSAVLLAISLRKKYGKSDSVISIPASSANVPPNTEPITKDPNVIILPGKSEDNSSRPPQA